MGREVLSNPSPPGSHEPPAASGARAGHRRSGGSGICLPLMKLNAVSKVILQAEIAPKSSPVCCILAGGRGQRMGGKDKAFIRLAGKTLLDHVASRLALQARAIVLNANGEPSRFAAFGLPVIADGISGHAGPLAGILAGLEWAAAEDASEMVSVAIDTPFLPRDLVTRL